VSIAPYVLAALVLLAAHLRDVRADRREAAIRAEHEDARISWDRERQELLNRIQAPHLIPMPARPVPVDEAEKPEDDEWDLVGTIMSGAEA
jgi:methionyl-tRNA formyltransferase